MQKSLIDSLISEASAEELFSVIKSENPQTQALVLSLLESQQAGRLLKMFSTSAAADLLQRMANLDKDAKQISQQIFEDLEEFLVENLQKLKSQHGSKRKLGGSDHVAKILSELPQSQASPVLDQLKESQPKLWESIDQAMFNLKVLKRIDAKDLVGFLAGVPDKVLILTLKNVAPDIKEQIFSALSKRRSEQITEDLQVKQRASDVSKAQQEFLNLLRLAIEKGTVKLLDPNDLWV